MYVDKEEIEYSIREIMKDREVGIEEAKELFIFAHEIVDEETLEDIEEVVNDIKNSEFVLVKDEYEDEYTTEEQAAADIKIEDCTIKSKPSAIYEEESGRDDYTGMNLDEMNEVDFDDDFEDR